MKHANSPCRMQPSRAKVTLQGSVAIVKYHGAEYYVYQARGVWKVWSNTTETVLHEIKEETTLGRELAIQWIENI